MHFPAMRAKWNETSNVCLCIFETSTDPTQVIIMIYEESVCLNLPGQPVSDRSEHFQVVGLLLVYVFVRYVTITLLSQYVRLNVYHQTMKTY